jgi:hypothetical protein
MKIVTKAFCIAAIFLLTMCVPTKVKRPEMSQLNKCANELKVYAQQKGYSTKYCLLIDMSMNSGLKRFFVYDLGKNTVAHSGLVAHGSCDQLYLKEVKFSNTQESGCTSFGVFRVGKSYRGHYGKSYRLHGLQNSNSNAFKRAVVIHALSCVPDEEPFPKLICNSSGCPMVSFAFLEKLSSVIDHSDKPILLWIYSRQAGTAFDEANTAAKF